MLIIRGNFTASISSHTLSPTPTTSIPSPHPCLPSRLGMLWQNKPTTCWWIIQIWLSDVWRRSCKGEDGVRNPPLFHRLNLQSNQLPSTPLQLRGAVYMRRRDRGAAVENCCCRDAGGGIYQSTVLQSVESELQLLQQLVSGNLLDWEQQEQWCDVPGNFCLSLLRFLSTFYLLLKRILVGSCQRLCRTLRMALSASRLREQTNPTENWQSRNTCLSFLVMSCHPCNCSSVMNTR